jgi:ABC-2 type transport system permease protein
MPIEGSRALFLAAAAMHLFAHDIPRHLPCHRSTVNAAIWPAWAIPLQLLSGGFTARESMPQIVQNIMLRAPTTHFVMLAQAILYRGAGFDLVWPQFIAIWLIATILFALVLFRFRKSIAEMS